MLALPLFLRVIHASSKAVSRITRVSGSKDPLPIPSMFPPYDRGCQDNVFWSLPQKVVEFLELPGASVFPNASFGSVPCNKWNPEQGGPPIHRHPVLMRGRRSNRQTK